MPSLQGGAAREYLEKTDDGRSLMEAVTAARFGLKWQERSPFDGPTNLSLSNNSGGYLGMSHVQNLNAWFDDEGVTIRPTLPKEKSDKAWRLGMRLKAYGYGDQLIDAPPIVSHQVKDNRIEYVRGHCRLTIADCRFETSSTLNSELGLKLPKDGNYDSSLFQSAIGNRQSAMTEWYENKAAGIEQGFTLNAPPETAGVGDDGPLRLVVALDGDLRALVKNDGSGVELFDKRGDAVLSYGQLVAKDAGRRLLPARMETDIDGHEIKLVVEDRGATYPIEIDPITATLELKLTAPSPQAAAEFGDAVAISGNVAAVGAFREDFLGSVDEGRVYIFTRSGSTWTFAHASPIRSSPSAQCGWSVAINNSGDRVASGCPGIDSNNGDVDLLKTSDRWSTISETFYSAGFGDRFGESVALYTNIFPNNTTTLVVGGPFTSNGSLTHAGTVWIFGPSSTEEISGTVNEGHFGTSVSIDGNNVIVGEPASASSTGSALLYSHDSGSWQFVTRLSPNDGSPGDDFGYSVAISGNTAVIGAPLNDNAKGRDAGAAYVFVRGSDGNWTQQQKLIPSDGIDQDQFGESVAIEGNTLVVGSPYNGSKTFTGTRGNGRSYVFTRNINVWSEQIIVSALFDGAPHDQFGINVAFSQDTVISGAEHASPGGTSDAGAAYIHRLSCVAPENWDTVIAGTTGGAFCPGASITIDALPGAAYVGTNSFSFQLRKNGVNIPGATTGIYEIRNVSAADAGTYDFIVSNSCGAEISTPFTLTGYTLSINPTSQNFGAAGSNGIVNVSSTGSSCGWTATSNAPWITVTSGSSGVGNGTVGFTVAANTGPQRTGTMTVAGQTFTVNQDGAAGPVIYVETGAPNRAVALDSVTFVRGPFKVIDDYNFSADHHTRVIIFTSNLGLTQPNPAVLTVQASGFNLPVENVGPLMGVVGLNGSYVVVRLPDGLPSGDLSLTVTLNENMSNITIISISP
jgi:hypothetical protein